MYIFIDREAREIMYLVASVRLSVRPSVRPSALSRLILGARLCRVRQRAKKSHYQSKVFVCVSNSRADAVDRLLIEHVSGWNTQVILDTNKLDICFLLQFDVMLCQNVCIAVRLPHRFFLGWWIELRYIIPFSVSLHLRIAYTVILGGNALSQVAILS